MTGADVLRMMKLACQAPACATFYKVSRRYFPHVLARRIREVPGPALAPTYCCALRTQTRSAVGIVKACRPLMKRTFLSLRD